MRDAPNPRWFALAAVAATVLALALAGAAAASTPTASDCAEGAEFIGNAARARDTGIRRDAFIDRMEADFVAIRGVPNELRWFAHDAADETFLLDAAREVFDRPAPPAAHAAAFLRACTNRRYV